MSICFSLVNYVFLKWTLRHRRSETIKVDFKRRNMINFFFIRLLICSVIPEKFFINFWQLKTMWKFFYYRSWLLLVAFANASIPTFLNLISLKARPTGIVGNCFLPSSLFHECLIWVDASLSRSIGFLCLIACCGSD